MADQKIIPFDRRPRAVDADGNKVSLKACEVLMMAEAGHRVEFAQLNSGFEMAFTWPPGRLPANQIDGVLVVRDGGYPFLLPFYRGSLGVIPLHGAYIPSGLEFWLQDHFRCLVREHAGADSREYEVELLHTFE